VPRHVVIGAAGHARMRSVCSALAECDHDCGLAADTHHHPPGVTDGSDTAAGSQMAPRR
jgi:hypothetical protein